MDIGIGLPNAVNGATGQQLLGWATKAETAGFSSVATIGAVSYPSHEELTVLAAVAAVTERVRLFTNVLISPARSTAELAKQSATVDQLSNGRLTLGLGVGWRTSDFVLTGRGFDQRGRAFDEQLENLPRAWAGERIADDTREVCPPPVQDPIPIVVGGTTKAALRRVVEHATGWTAGGMPPDAVAGFAEKVRNAWKDAGRSGAPRICALVYFGLGDTEAESRRNLLHYYEPQGPEVAASIADSALRTDDAVLGAVKSYADAGVDELILDASVTDPTQVDLLADVVFG